MQEVNPQESGSLPVQALTPDELERKLSADFPKNATCWSQATDEVRDMCRRARVLAGVGEEGAVDFRAVKTPAEWNTLGIEGTVRFYGSLGESKRQEFCADFGHWLGLVPEEE